MIFVMLIEMSTVLSLLGRYVVAKSDQINPFLTIQPGSALQDYLCNGHLKSKMTVALVDGEYRISSVPLCNISNQEGITLTGSSSKRTIVRCDVDGGAFFVSGPNLTVARITFINCCMQLTSIENTFIVNCTFLNSSNGAISSRTSNNTYITNSVFSDIRVEHNGEAAVMLNKSKGNVSIRKCTFQSRGVSVGGNGRAVRLYKSTGTVIIADCTFVNNSVITSGGAVMLDQSASNVIISDCIFQNNFATNGGAVILDRLTSNINIIYCTFQNNSASNGGGAVILTSISNVRILHSTFQNNNSTYGGAVRINDSKGNFSITNSTFQYNNASEGGAMLLIGDLIINHCTFQVNSGSGDSGAVMFQRPTANINISNCTFQNNYAMYGGSVRLNVITGDICIEKCRFLNNIASHSGGAVVLDALAGNVWINKCRFINNNATLRGGSVMMNGSTGNVNIIHSSFQMNSGYLGGAIHILSMCLNMYMYINRSSFTSNTAAAGAAIYDEHYSNEYIMQQAEFNQLVLQDVTVKDSHCYSDTCAGAIYLKGVKMDIFGNTDTGSHFSLNSPQGAIQGENGFLLLHGYITFANNTGVNGGAISLSNNVPLYFNPNCTVEFIRNVATGYGGAIYNNGKQFIAKDTFWTGYDRDICILRLLLPDVTNKMCNASLSINFTYNHAQKGGHAVYATPIYHCDRFCEHNLTNYFKITPLPEDINDGQVVSFPEHVHYCGCSDPNLCNGTSQYLTTYPGRTVRLNVTSVDDGKLLSPSVVFTQVDASGVTPQNIMLGPQQSTQWIGTVCGIIEYQIYGPEMASLKLLLSNDPSGSPTIIQVKLLACEPGFTLMPDVSTIGMKCDCSLFFTSLGVACDTSDGTVTRSKTNWIGVYNNSDPALAETCPLDYCNRTIKKLSPARPGYLCNGGRTGIICGHCHGNLSVIFGSSKCQECSDMWLTTLVMFAVLGVILVAALFFLNLTITQGTLYGLIFYANIIQVNTSIFFNQSTLNPLQVIVSFVNLDLGLPMCFYNGMDDADKAGLQFVFPAYLLILTMATILACHYCLQRSPTTSSTSFLCILSNIIGERAVGVLSTLIYLSYSKLLRTFIDILTYSTIHLPSGDMYVWFYDGNVQYLRGKHTVLFVVAITTCTLFLLPYTIALTFIPIIEQHSEHNRLFKYLHKKANQIKPMNDAYYAPYKGEWRWWLGARLWLLVVMFTLNPVYSSDKPSLLLTIQATMVILFSIAQAGIKPFGESHELKHKCNRRTNFYNQLYNSLDMFYLLNYTALAMSMSYILDQSSDQTQTTVVTVGVLVGLFVVMLMATVLYHLIVAILRVFKKYDGTRVKFNGLFDKKTTVPIELDEPTNDTVSAITVTVNDRLREPLCED